MPKTTRKIEHAIDEDEAERLLREFCKEIDFDPGWIDADAWSTSLRMACDPTIGLKTTYDAILADKDEKAKDTAKEKRRRAITTKLNALVAKVRALDGTSKAIISDALAAFLEASAQYIDGAQTDMTYSTAVKADRYAQMAADWERLAKLAASVDSDLFFGFKALEPENKDEKGKGSVGATLARRKVQGNMFVSFVSVRFNIHVDIAKG
ncbi:hypothetical protein ACIRBX_23125 [Kitasatospora sp. NPDC096147]|uniref:hypothetical protein n=1 Tax=Kitasatospora sp. NPDC096147 TaxID=3364093 RepID=UPI0037F7B80A